MKTKLFFILIIILSFALRFAYLDKYPIGYYSDEAAFSYNAYSVLKTGRDEYGTFLPIALKSFGDYKAAFYSYYLIPFVGIFGLTETATRAGSATLGIIEVILIYLLTRELFSNKKLPLLCACLAALMPLALQFNRMVHENNLVVVLISLAIFFFLRSLKSYNYLIFSATAFVASLYAYHDARVFVPLILLVIFFIYRKNILEKKSIVIVSIGLFIILMVPLFRLVTSNEFWARPKNTIIFGDSGIINQINQETGENLYLHFNYPRIFHNKIVAFPIKFAQNYLTHFNPDFLLFSGDPVKIYRTVDNGIIYFFMYPFLLLGIYFVFKKNINHKSLLIAWLLLSPVPSSLTRFVPSASRIMEMLPPLVIFIGVGLYYTFDDIRSIPKKNILILLLATFCIGNIAYYLNYYYFNTGARYEEEWHYGMKDVYAEVEKIQNNYSLIWSSKKAWGYIYALFYLQYPPAKYQPQAKLGSLDEYGFGWVDGFDKYKFGRIPQYFDFSQNILYVLNPGELKFIVNPLKAVNYPSGGTAYIIIDTGTIQKYCPKCSLENKPKNVNIYGETITQ